MKTIVTHIGPDLDAITSIWLVKTFFPHWEEAQLAFVPAGTTLEKLPPDDNPEVIHVDTGFGMFDHHQNDDDTCAAQLVYNRVKELHGQDPAMERLVAVVNDVDHFRQVFFPNPNADYWSFQLEEIIDGWRLIHSDNPQKLAGLGMDCLDAIYKELQNKVWAEKEIKENSTEFETKWGKSLALETTNDDVIHVAQKMGYRVVLRKDPKKQYVRIKSLPVPDIDLTPLYNTLKTIDNSATWFLHASLHMILNGSTKNPDMRPSTLSLEQIVDIMKKIT